jgi:paired amphipathic helix protein Sin3a
LEILQTYQRESKPIQDVYAQVTTLFNTAPDLLEDFKQFLPESAAQAKAAAKAAEDAAAMGLANVSQTPQPHPPRGDQKLPPVGQFAPPNSTSKDTKSGKRPRPVTQTNSVAMGSLAESTGRPSIGQANNANKVSASTVLSISQSKAVLTSQLQRIKTTHASRPAEDVPAVSPTLTPLKPLPMSPIIQPTSQQGEVAFFDKVKKYLSNKQVFAEFLKLCNLFSQDLIDKAVLVHKVSNFIGANIELMDYFKQFVNYTGNEEVVENKPRAPTDKVSLSNCRGLGPSYRLLPKRERLKSCSGRDDMCYSVLNDDWASHPTWASEDSGFVAHRKNIYEEALHRIEEERHDYDFNIEANAKVIQLLEPVCHQILNLQPHEMASFRMPSGFGGQSQSVYKRIFKKIYGTEKGNDVTADLFKDPIAVLPVVLARLKQKDEEWRFTQREWDKVWHAQTAAMYLKSLDHQGIHVKQADKKMFTPKNLCDPIKTKFEEQRRKRAIEANVPRYQFKFNFDDEEVIVDAIRCAILYVINANQHNLHERDRIAEFFEDFIPMFFGIPSVTVQDRVKDISRGSPDEDMEEAPAELSNGRGRRTNGRTDGLLRGVLDRGRKGRGKGNSVASGSKESTPDTGSAPDDEDAEMADGAEEQTTTDAQHDRWLQRPPDANALLGSKPLEQNDFELKADQPFSRDWYSLYCNQTIYIFFTFFEILYRRLRGIKASEKVVTLEVKRIRAPKAAKEIGLLEERNDWFSEESTETYYHRTLLVIEEYIMGEIDEVKYQEFLRTYYLQKGWAVYTISELLKNLCRYAAACTTTDSKDKTPEIINGFVSHRLKDEITYNQEIDLRKKVEKLVKNDDMYLIRYVSFIFKFPSQVHIIWLLN